LNLQAGGRWYGTAGFGRPDARPHFNLNFDPNDSVALGAGHVAASGARYTLFVVADNRFHTQHRDRHVNAQIPFASSLATLDLLRKSFSAQNVWRFSRG
jgi:hypothetical protein